uniref:CCHC-type domain-containing protein n=1 Tax=Chrysemys picta bellii TaxID=8478 RepID=A0A8C3HFR1_CHRPI
MSSKTLACYACGVRGHIRRDCPYGVGGRVPRPEQGKRQVPQAGRWVREPRRLKICWACGREGHLWWACPGPRQRVQVSPSEGAGPWRDSERPTTAKKRQVCWGCQKPGHIRRHCPLKGVEGRPMDVPGGPGGATLDLEKVTEAEVEMVGTQQGVGTQTITEPVANGETQTEGAQQEAGTQVVVGQETKWTQTLRVEAQGESDLHVRLEAAERALHEWSGPR